MGLTSSLETEIWQVYNTWLSAYLNADVTTYDSYLDDDYHFIGSTNNEEFLKRIDATTFFEQTGDQFAGIMDLRNEKKILEVFDSSIIITHFCDVWFINDTEHTYYGRFRLSSVLQKKKESWRFIYQHFSMPDSKSDEGDSIGFDKVNAENIELKEAIKRRTIELENKNRELEIEAALERVRARTMAMQRSEEMADAAFVLFEQLRALGGNLWATGFGLCEQNKDEDVFWFANENGVLPRISIPNTVDPAHLQMFQGWEDDKELLSIEGSGQALKEHYEYFMTLPEVRPIFQKILDDGLTFPDWQQWNAAYFSHGYLLIITLEPYPEPDILKRFAKVFEQTYTRFLDLQKAEEQSRESEIQLALERVRARTMAMQTSDELAEVGSILFKQIGSLDINPETSWITFINPEEEYLEIRVTYGDKLVEPVAVSPDDHENFKKEIEAWKSGQESIQIIMPKEDFTSTVKTFFNIDVEDRPENSFFHVLNVRHQFGFLGIGAWNEISEEQTEIYQRFAKVFDQTYTRFLDLQKAEEQAREAQIEAAIERVRSQSMAMHKSEELADTIGLMQRELANLEFALDNCIFWIIEKESNEARLWVAPVYNTYLPESYHMPFTDLPYFRKVFHAWEHRNPKWTYVLEGENKKKTDDYLFNHTGFKKFPDEIKEAFRQVKKTLITISFYNYGGLHVSTTEPLSELQADILSRFSKVFDQTYTRFLDLQKAEEQNRQAQINLALERVRARSLAMQKPDDLNKVNEELLRQLQELHIDGLSGVSIWLIDNEGLITAWDLSNPGNMRDPRSATLRYEATKFDLIGEPWRIFNSSDMDYVVLDYPVEKLRKAVKEWAEVDTSIADEFQEALDNGSLTHQWNPLARHSHGFLSIDLVKPPSDGIREIVTKMAGVFSLAYRRFLDLQKAEEQAREAEIQLALERVRAKSLAMHKSEELGDLSLELVKQVQNLGLETWFCAFNIHDDHPDGSLEWGSNGEAVFPQYRTPKEGIFLEYLEAGQRGEKLYIREIPESECEAHYEYLCTLPGVGEQLLEMKANGIPFPSSQIDHVAFFKYGYVLFITFEPAPEAHDTFKRFAHVFEQSYTRFLDLQKAETQAREAKIEAALEKVRSRTMAMQKGEELQEVAVLLYKELIALGVTNFVTCGYVEVNEEIKRQHTWVTAPGGDTMGLFHLPLTGDATFDARYAAWKKQQTVFHQSVAGQVRSDHLEYAITTFNSKEAEEMVRSQFPDPTVFYCFNFSHGYLHTVGGALLEKEEEKLLARFTKVFEQTYTRFLDLQKAEEQAREAKIEMSLEKIRSRTMGMQSSEELPEVANMLFLEVQELDIPAWSCGYCILEKDHRSSICIMSSEGTIQKPFLLPHYGEPSFDEWDDFIHSDQTFLTQELKDEDIESHYDFMLSLPQLKPVFQDLKDEGLSMPVYQVNHLSKFSNGFLLFITYEEVPGAHDIFKRFTSVFDQTYTRFLDLQKSEVRAREAEVELSLERVRSQVSAMQESSDLQDIVVTMRNEFTSLGHDAHYFWYMRWLPDQYKKAMTSGDGSKIGMVMTLPRHIHGDIKKVADWEQSDEPTLVLDMDTEQAVDYVDKMISLGDFEQLDPQAPTLDDIRHIGGLTFIMARTSQGEIGYSLPGVVPDPPEDAIQTFIRFAGVFDFAYQRFEDLKEAEKQARLIREERDRLEDALAELHATQDQLIQQEKLASLGQLTAGIAHEIKNPLNFVNNFSEVSVELVEETKEELLAISDRLSAEDKEKVEEALEILLGIEMNLKKIHEHGSRADSIVKSMLEHSRGGSGKLEPTHLNSVVKEFVNLSFHGMRAGKEPIDVDITYELNEETGEVPLIAEDFSRVILNLCNNAFDAMRQKVSTDKSYKPLLTIRTISEKDKVTIEIEDNGPGIPEDIKDKIMQPFFTTKKGTEGTGLGLSITNDIIQAHGGVLELHSTPFENTIFKIKLAV